jgi:transcription-repair coupling factor (superfamily II helicase)
MTLNQEKFLSSRIEPLLKEGSKRIELYGTSGADKAYCLHQLFHMMQRNLLVILPSFKEAEELFADIQFFSHGSSSEPILFPPYNLMPFKFIKYHNETAAQRVKGLYQAIYNSAESLIVTSVEGLLQRVIPRKVLSDYTDILMTGEENDRDALVNKLELGGYNRTLLVEEPGDYCIRGGILDLFSPMYQDPIRLEWFGDVVESLRFFSPTSQRTVADTSEVILLPASESVLENQDRKELLNRIRIQAAELELPPTKVREIVAHIEIEGVLPEISGLNSLIYEKLDRLSDYLPDDVLYVIMDQGEVEKSARAALESVQQNYDSAILEKRFCIPPEVMYSAWEAVNDVIVNSDHLTFSQVPISGTPKDDLVSRAVIDMSIRDNSNLKMALEHPTDPDRMLFPLVKWIRENDAAGNRTLIVCRTKNQLSRLRSLLEPYDLTFESASDLTAVWGSRKRVWGCVGALSSGFVWDEASLAVVTEAEIFGARRRRKPSRSKTTAELLRLEELKTGTLVVHDEHGIGRYEGLVKLGVERSHNDYLLIVYRNDDKLYLPVDRINVIQKYMGVDGTAPVLDKMGGNSWAKVKERVKRSAEKIAGELLKLYASRRVNKRRVFSKPGTDFNAFESAFTYEETGDQLKAIQDVIDDMTRETPMDRLVCGDVGYGKTEVALRASFIAVNDEKQVAVLVPTTVLAEQHFLTFSARFKRFPFNVACLSRFRSVAAQRDIVKKLKEGKIDIVIGTHRLLSKDVGFKNLGLMVLDEEQRFGVKHKEKLKKMRETVDVLTLTATPIPRTLHLSLTGIRDISIISTPPEYRQPIKTYICEFDDGIVTDAIRKELRRKGQIFFVHNNIKSIYSVARHIQHLVPEMRMKVAHGQMKETELEAVMLDFANKKIDLLICTTIIESGLDIPAANTMLVNRADRFGLSQMYQLRGRIGRAEDQAFAYLFIPKESALTKDAKKRLKVLMEHSDLGAGFQIALSDLKIRGGGTILGASQSGHIAAVGYDMFLKLMEEAIGELKGKPLKPSLEPEINMALSAFLPEEYIADIDQRLSTYRRLAKITTLGAINDFKAELMDRFGPLPSEANNLLLKIMLRVLSIRAGVNRLDITGNHLILSFSVAHQKEPGGIVDMIRAKPNQFSLRPDHTLKVNFPRSTRKQMLAQVKNILKEIIQRVNS